MSLYNNENQDAINKIGILKKDFPKEMLQTILNELLNKKLTKLEYLTKGQMSDLNKISKNFKDLSKSIQQISNNALEKSKSTEENKNNNNNETIKLNNNILKHSIKKLKELGNDIITTTKKNNNAYNLRTRSNTLGISKNNQLKKINTEVNLNRGSFISNNNKQKSKLKSPDKNNNKINKNINITKELGKNATPKKSNKLNLIFENKQKFPQTEKIPKKINEKMKIQNNNKNIIINNEKEYMNEFDNFNFDSNKSAINSAKKEIKEKNKKDILKANKKFNDNYKKNEFDIEKTNKNGLNNSRSSYNSKRDKKLFNFNGRNNTMNNSTNFNDIQSIVKLVDNVNQNITKLLNDNNSNEIFIPNNLRNSVTISKSNININMSNKKSDFTLKKKYLSKKEKVKNINVLEIFKKDKKILKNILKYLPENELIYFYSINNYFNKERISYFDNKKEDLLSILNLKKEETIENKINEIKNQFNKENLSQIKNFEISKEIMDKIKLINAKDFLDEIKNMKINNTKGKLIILYKIFFVFLGEEKIYNTLNIDIFWEKCFNYFKEKCKGNIGNFIIHKIHLFNFGSKEFNRIRNLLKENQNEIINELLDNKNCLMPLIKELFEYFGIIFSKDKTEGNIYINNLKRNQIVINYLNNLKVRYFLSRYNEDEEED